MGGDVHPLRAWRIREGYTLDAAAAGVDTVRSTWHDWETGRRLPGDRDTYERIYRFTKGQVSANTLIFPFGFPAIGQMPLPFDGPPAPLLDHANAAIGNGDNGASEREHGDADAATLAAAA